MKKSIFLVSFLALCFISFAQVNLQTLIKPGAKLIYSVDAGGQKYDFIVTVKTLVPAVVFDWAMTNDSKSSGTITHTAPAMTSANTMYNYFSPGAKSLDDNTLSVWISKNTFTALTKGIKSVMLKMNTNEEAKKMAVTNEDPEELKIIVDGEKDTIEEFMATDASGGGSDQTYFTFSTSAKMPVILRMKNEFYIVLKEIKTK